MRCAANSHTTPPHVFLNSWLSKAPKTILRGQCGYGPIGHIGHFLKGFLPVSQQIPTLAALNSWLSKLPLSDIEMGAFPYFYVWDFPTLSYHHPQTIGKTNRKKEILRVTPPFSNSSWVGMITPSETAKTLQSLSASGAE